MPTKPKPPEAESRKPKAEDQSPKPAAEARAEDRHQAIVMTTLAKVGAKHGRRELLQAGCTHLVKARVKAEIDGFPLDPFSIEATLAIGHDKTQSRSTAAPVEGVVGYLLDQLSKKKRDELLRSLPEQYAAAGCQLPEISGARIEEARGLLGRLRSSTESTVRGDAACSGIRVG